MRQEVDYSTVFSCPTRCAMILQKPIIVAQVGFGT